MRQLLSSAVSALLLSTAACSVAEPVIIRRTVAPSSMPAVTKADTGSAETAETKAATGLADDIQAAARGASDPVVIPVGWSLVTSPENGFRAALPSSPEVKEQLLKTDSGDVRMTSYGVPLSGDGYLMVIVGQYPDGAMSGKPADVLLKRAGEYTLEQNHFTQVSEEALMVNGARGSGVSFPGRDIEAIERPSGRRLSLRMLLAGDRVYQLLFVREGGTAEPFRQLLSSFSLQ